MKTTIDFPQYGPVKADVLGDVAVHRPLGEKKDWVLTYVPELRILGRVRLKATAKGYQKRFHKLGFKDADAVFSLCSEVHYYTN